MARKKNNLSIIDFYDSESPESTEFRRILKNIDRYNTTGDKKAILITSSMLSEGKSLISALMSIVSGQSRHNKTLLIDFDLRRPMVHKLFNIPLENGVSDILFNGISPRMVIKTTSVDKLDLITAGEIVANPSELFNGPAINKIFEELKFYYDLILVDSPPLLPVMDPMLLIDELDGAVIVVKAGATNRDVINRAKKLVNSQKKKIIGVVVNNLNQTLPYYYNYNYYGYHAKTDDMSKRSQKVEINSPPKDSNESSEINDTKSARTSKKQ